MGIGGISIWQLLIVLAIVVLLFGTKKLRGIGTDLGSAIKGFRSSLKEGETENEAEQSTPAEQLTTQQKTSTAEQQTKTQEKV